MATFTPTPDAYRLETYWSEKAHQFGVDGIPVKYIVKPCTSNGTYVPTKAVDFSARGKDFVQEELKRHVESPLKIEPPACFEFYLQTAAGGSDDRPRRTRPSGRRVLEVVEDTTLEWKESEAPAYRVGRISLRGPVLPSESCDDPKNFIRACTTARKGHPQTQTR